MPSFIRKKLKKILGRCCRFAKFEFFKVIIGVFPSVDAGLIGIAYFILYVAVLYNLIGQVPIRFSRRTKTAIKLRWDPTFGLLQRFGGGPKLFTKSGFPKSSLSRD